MSENQVMAQAVRTFHGEEGAKNPASAPFPVSRARFADLAANGLVVEAKMAEASAGAGDPEQSEGADVAAAPESTSEQVAAAPEARSSRGSRARQ